MRTLKVLLAIAIIAWATFADVEINATNFPDGNFRTWILSQNYGDGNTTLTDAEIAGITNIDVNSKSISDLKGIEYFTALEYLNCDNNQLTELDVSANTALTTLNCSYNELIELDVSANTALTTLNCNHNYTPEANVPAKPDGVNESNWITLPQYTGVPINKTTFPDGNFRAWALSQSWGSNDSILSTSEIAGITNINVNSKSISDLKGIEYFTALTILSCSNNQLTELDVSKNESLIDLYCYNNQLTELDVSKNESLIDLYCSNNQLTELDVSANTALEYLDCDNNQLTELDVSNNTALTILSCSNNQLTELDVSANTALTYLNCSDNYIPEAELPVNNVGATIWTTLPQYIVAVFMNGEEIYRSDTVTTASGTITKPTDPTQTGYTFNGWYKEKALTNLWDFDTDEFTGITTLYAGGFTPIEYTITWDVGGNETTTDVAYDATPVFDGTPSKTSTAKYSYTFKEWSPAIAAVSGAQTYTAVFDSTIRKHTVTFDCNGGSEVASQSIEYEGKIVIPANPTKAGFDFIGWHEGDTLFDMESAITRNITLTAEWDETVAINKTQNDSRFGIKFAQNIVSTSAEMSVVLPNSDKATQTNITVYDMTGNVVFVGAQRDVPASSFVWDLRNSAGRTVANGTYLVIAEVKGQNGMSYHYSAKLGVKR